MVEVTKNIEIEITVFCHNCGAELNSYINRGDVEVDPCEKCLVEAYNEGLNHGQN